MVSAAEILDGSVRVDYSLQLRSSYTFEPGERVMGVRDLSGGHVGIISACAEQTRRSRSASPACRDHLRVCGADAAMTLDVYADLGSSPRVRSRPRPPRSV